MSSPQQDPTSDLLQALVAAGVVETFQALPLAEQDKFLIWIENAPDADAYRRRIDILVMGIRMAPLSDGKRRSLRDRPDFWTNPMGRAEGT